MTKEEREKTEKLIKHLEETKTNYVNASGSKNNPLNLFEEELIKNLKKQLL